MDDLQQAFLNDCRKALLLAAEALEIASEWGLQDVQANPPPEWGLVAYDENAEDGWVAAAEVAKICRFFAETQVQNE